MAHTPVTERTDLANGKGEESSVDSFVGGILCHSQHKAASMSLKNYSEASQSAGVALSQSATELGLKNFFHRIIESNMSQTLDNDDTHVLYSIREGLGKAASRLAAFRMKMTFLSCATLSAAACAAPRAARGFAIGAPIPTSRASRG